MSKGYVAPYYQQLLPARAVATRYGVHLRSVSRWVARGVIPPPTQIIADRRYWSLEVLEAADRARTIEAGSNSKSVRTIESGNKAVGTATE